MDFYFEEMSNVSIVCFLDLNCFCVEIFRVRIRLVNGNDSFIA